MLSETSAPPGANGQETGRDSIMLIDRQRAFTDALAQALPGSDLEIVATTTSAGDAAPLIRSLRPRLVVADLNGSIAGLHELLQISEVRLKETSVAVLTDGLSDALLDHLLRLNVSCLSKCDSLSDLTASMRALIRGERTYSTGIRRRLDAAGGEGPHFVKQQGRLNDLSPRQLEVLQLLAEGRRVKDVAQAMHLSEKAVESHKYRIMNQLNIHDRVELCLYAIREGLITV